jgi:hypothetical protein
MELQPAEQRLRTNRATSCQTSVASPRRGRSRNRLGPGFLLGRLEFSEYPPVSVPMQGSPRPRLPPGPCQALPAGKTEQKRPALGGTPECRMKAVEYKPPSQSEFLNLAKQCRAQRTVSCDYEARQGIRLSHQGGRPNEDMYAFSSTSRPADPKTTDLGGKLHGLSLVPRHKPEAARNAQYPPRNTRRRCLPRGERVFWKYRI